MAIISTPLSKNPYALLVDTVTGEVLEIYFYTDVTNNVSPQYDKVDVRGREGPHQHYSFTGPDTLILNGVVLLASAFENDGGQYEDAMNQWAFIKSLMYPDYDAGAYIDGPHRVRLKLGDFYDEEGKIEEFTSTAKPPFDENHLPARVEVGFVFERTGIPRSYSDIRRAL